MLVLVFIFHFYNFVVEIFVRNFDIKLQVVPMLAMVVLVFLLCWSPILVFELLQSFDIVHW